MAASYAGIGFSNAGVHLPHGASYGNFRATCAYRAPGYLVDHPLVPHGISVILNAPAVFLRAPANGQHLEAAAATASTSPNGWGCETFSRTAHPNSCNA